MIADLPTKERVAAYMGLFRDLAERPSDPDFGYFRNAPAAILVTSNTNTEEMHKPFHKADAEIAGVREKGVRHDGATRLRRIELRTVNPCGRHARLTVPSNFFRGGGVKV